MSSLLSLGPWEHRGFALRNLSEFNSYSLSLFGERINLSSLGCSMSVYLSFSLPYVRLFDLTRKRVKDLPVVQRECAKETKKKDGNY